MAIWDAVSDILEAAMPWTVIHAEAPAEAAKKDAAEAENEEKEAGGKEVEGEEDAEEARKDTEKAEDAEEKEEEEEQGGEGEEEKEEEEEEEDEDEEDEDEIVDPKETLEEECKKSAHCAPAKHHFDECVERVQKQQEDGQATEDCVEEFFHLAHCATACAAPKLWSKLK